MGAKADFALTSLLHPLFFRSDLSFLSLSAISTKLKTSLYGHCVSYCTMASPTDPVVSGMISRIDQLADGTLSKVDRNPTGSKEQHCSKYLVEAVDRCRRVLIHCVKTYDRIERKKEAVEQAETFFPSMQHILDAGVFAELMYSTSLTDRSFHEKFLQLEELAASIDKICGQYVPYVLSFSHSTPYPL